MSDRLFEYGLSFLLLKICKDKEDIKCLIFKKNSFDYIKKGYDKMGYPISTHVCKIICKIGDLPLLKYAHKNGCKFGDLASFYAVQAGHLDCVKYLHENGCEWYYATTSEAAKIGRLDILKYAHENGCPWNTKTAFEAALHKHLDCLLYANEVHIEFFKGFGGEYCDDEDYE